MAGRLVPTDQAVWHGKLRLFAFRKLRLFALWWWVPHTGTTRLVQRWWVVPVPRLPAWSRPACLLQAGNPCRYCLLHTLCCCVCCCAAILLWQPYVARYCMAHLEKWLANTAGISGCMAGHQVLPPLEYTGAVC